MGQLHVLFEVPRFIEYGLSTGAFQRVGGVIVESGSKQIVAWLRDGSLLETGVKAVANAVNPLNLVLQAGQAATSLIDGHLTRRAIGALGQQVAAHHAETMQAIGALGQSIKTVGMLTALTASGQVLNLAITAATFRAVIRRLERLSAAIEQLEQKIRDEFKRDRDIDFRAALLAARDAFESRQESTRNSKAQDASIGLYRARENFFTDLDDLLQKDLTRDQLNLAQHLLIRAMYAETSRIRCYMISGDDDLAKDRMSEDMPRFDSYTRNLINLWLGEHPVIYFHKDVPAEYLSRFFRIQQWLLGIDAGNDAFAMFQIIAEIRSQFWDTSVLGRKSVIATIKQRSSGSRFSVEELSELEENLLQAELLIENYERLAGFDLEIRSMRLSFDEWSNLVDDEQLEEHGGALIVDDEIAERYARLSM